MVSIKDITSTFTPEKKMTDTLWARMLIRPISLGVTWFAVNIGLNAFQISCLAALMPIAALGCFLHNHPLAAIVLLNIWLVMDCVDGNMARFQGPTPMGEFVDSVSGYIMIGLTFFSLGIYLNMIGFGTAPWIWSMLGGLASISNLLSRIVYQKYRSVKDGNETVQNIFQNKGVLYIEKNLGIGGFLTPAMLVVYFTGHLEKYLIFYCLYSVGLALGVVFRLLFLSR